MNINMLIFAPLWFLLCWMLPADSMEIRLSFRSRLPFWPNPLTMVEGAADDMYFSCNKAMADKVRSTFFKQENTGQFEEVWGRAADCANKKLNERAAADEALTKDHLQAICVYTSHYGEFYKTFNDAVRKNMKSHKSSFQFSSLHFWLTSAVQILNKNTGCVTTYRKSNLKFSVRLKKIIRFGFFASSSLKTTLQAFGHKTCFKIRTCSGGFLKHYSVFGDSEQEVLIPPYEMFKITDKKKGGDVDGLSDCEVVFLLESAGVHSSMNCRAVNS